MACHPFADALFFSLAETKKKQENPVQAMCDGARRAPCSHTHTLYVDVRTGKMCSSGNAKKLNSKFSGRPI